MPVNCQIHYYVFRYYGNVKILYKVMCFRLKGVGLLVNAIQRSPYSACGCSKIHGGISCFLFWVITFFSLNSISVHFNIQALLAKQCLKQKLQSSYLHKGSILITYARDYARYKIMRLFFNLPLPPCTHVLFFFIIACMRWMQLLVYEVPFDGTSELLDVSNLVFYIFG